MTDENQNNAATDAARNEGAAESARRIRTILGDRLAHAMPGLAGWLAFERPNFPAAECLEILQAAEVDLSANAKAAQAKAKAQGGGIAAAYALAGMAYDRETGAIKPDASVKPETAPIRQRDPREQRGAEALANAKALAKSEAPDSEAG